MKRPFLTIVTRCWKKPKSRRINLASVESLVDQDIQHLLLIDEEGHGLDWADVNLYVNRHECLGEYVMVLDDDDMIIRPTAIGELKKIVEDNDRPGVVLFRGLVGNKALPALDRDWGCRVRPRNIAMFCSISRNDIYARFIRRCKGGKRGDFYYMRQLISAQDVRVVWKNIVIAATQQKSGGRSDDKRDKLRRERWP